MKLIKLFPSRKLQEISKQTGAVVRKRKVDIEKFFWTIVLGFGTGRERTIAGLRRAYQKATGTQIEESSFYDRFTPGFVKMLQVIVGSVIKTLFTSVDQSLQGSLAGFQDLIMTDSTVIRLHELLAKAFPGSRTNHSKAALKMHVVMSARGAGKNSIKITNGRRHDGPVFKVDTWIRDRLLLFDLGYFCFNLFARIMKYKGYFVSRLKDSANPVIVSNNCTHHWCCVDLVGCKLKDTLGKLKRETLDVMVEIKAKQRVYAGQRNRKKLILRVVGIRDPETKEYHLYITNISPEKLSAEDIQRTYACRWCIELLFKELKTHYRLEDLPSSKRHVVEALIYSAILTLMVSRTILQELKKKMPDKANRLPMQRWAGIFASISQDLLLLAVQPPRLTKMIERLITQMILNEAIDPNVDRPSLIESVEKQRHEYRRKAA
jgi:IS4 transposase